MKAVLCVCGSVSILFQAIGLFSPAWVLIDITMKGDMFTEQSGSFGLGLFTVHACSVDRWNEENCQDLTMGKFADVIATNQTDAYKVGVEGFIGSFLPIQILTILGILASIVALVPVFVYDAKASCCSYSSKCSGVFGACLWIFSGILLTGAVCYAANQYSTHKTREAMVRQMPEISDIVEISVHFPWAPAMTAAGALLSFLIGLIASIRLCYSSNETILTRWALGTNSQTKLLRLT